MGKGVGSEGNESRALLLEAWVKLESTRMQTLEEAAAESKARDDLDLEGNREFLAGLKKRLPKKTKVRKALGVVDGEEEFEEKLDYVFPDDTKSEQNLKILEMAAAWKAKKLAMASSSS